MVKQNHFKIAFVVLSEILNSVVLTAIFQEKKVTQANIVVPVFQGNELCYTDGKIESFSVIQY